MDLVEGLEDELVGIASKMGGHLLPERHDEGRVGGIGLGIAGRIAQVGLEGVVVGVEDDVQTIVQCQVDDTLYLVEMMLPSPMWLVHVAGIRTVLAPLNMSLKNSASLGVAPSQ